MTRRKQHQPGITPHDETTHVPTAGSSAVLTKPNHEPAWCSCARVVMLYGPTRHSTAKGASQRTLYRRSAQEYVQLDLNHVIAEEYETRKCIWTAAASYDMELDRGDGICVAIFGQPKTYLPGPIISGVTVLAGAAWTAVARDENYHQSHVRLAEVTTTELHPDCTRPCDHIKHSTMASTPQPACSTGARRPQCAEHSGTKEG